MSSKNVQTIGPPETNKPITPQTQNQAVGSSSKSCFMDLTVANFNTTEIPTPPKGSRIYGSSGYPILDFFFYILPDTPYEYLTDRLERAWKSDALSTLKLICNLRGVRGTGKADSKNYYRAALWLHKNHPKTFAYNLKLFAEFGSFEDFLVILNKLNEGLEVVPEVRSIVINPFLRKKKSTVAFPKDKIQARIWRQEKNCALRIRALEKLGGDPDYRFLYDKICELYAQHLISDLQFMKSGELDKISLASKWCPSLRSSFENSTLFTESIARKVYPRNSYPEYEGVEEAHYAKRIRHRLRKEFLSPLRKALELPEVYIGSNKLDSLPYDRVSSLDMKKYKKFFMKHDEERFKKYLESVKRGDAKIAAGELLPCEIYEGTGCIVAELQWQRMVSDLLEKGRLKDCLAICDVSGSMVGPPLQASLALGLLISEISEHPWKGKLITFNNHSQLQEIKGDDLCSKRMFVRSIKWNMPTDFQKVFDTILQVAIDGNLKEDQVIKRVFVFSDMRFDKASKNYFEWAADYPTLDTAFSWETDYETIKRKFRESGYMSVPEIVFWNLRSSGATPVTWEQNGVAMVSGFSKNMLNLFIDGGDLNDLTPISVMKKAISAEEYDKLVVID